MESVFVRSGPNRRAHSSWRQVSYMALSAMKVGEILQQAVRNEAVRNEAVRKEAVRMREPVNGAVRQVTKSSLPPVVLVAPHRRQSILVPS